MGFFYFDESIQQRAEFIVGAFVYSETDLTPAVFKAISGAGLEPRVDEFKSGMQMDSRPDQVKARAGVAPNPPDSSNRSGRRSSIGS